MRVGICTKCGNTGRQFSQRCFNCNEARFRYVDGNDLAKIQAVQAEIRGTHVPGSEIKSLLIVGLVASSVALAAFLLIQANQPAPQEPAPQAISSTTQSIR